MDKMGLRPSRGEVLFMPEADSSPGCASPISRDEASLLGGPTVSALLHHSKDYPVVPAVPPDGLPLCLAQQNTE